MSEDSEVRADEDDVADSAEPVADDATGARADTESDTDTESDSDTESDTDTESDSDSESDFESNSETAADSEADLEALREQVEAEYDFENFGPAEMADMSAEEWEAAFDPDTWITGEELLDRVEADLKNRVAERDVFARIERFEDRLIAYSDTGYATVYGDGSIEGRGTVLRDVKPTVALCSMESYDVPENPPEERLPEPTAVPEGSGDLGNRMLQVVAGIQVLAGLGLLVAWALISLKVIPVPGGGSLRSLNVWVMLFAGIGFAVIGIFLFSVVANARLSDKFRAEEFRNRLRAVGIEEGEQPDFLPDDMTVEDLAAGPGPGDTDGELTTAGDESSADSSPDTDSGPESGTAVEGTRD